MLAQNGTPFLLTRCTAELKYANVSNAYAARMGRRPEDLEGKPIVDFIGREALETLFPYIRKALQGERVEYETDVKYLGAGVRRVQFTYVPERDAVGNVCGWIASKACSMVARSAAKVCFHSISAARAIASRNKLEMSSAWRTFCGWKVLT